MIAFLFNGSLTGNYTYILLCILTAVVWKVFFNAPEVPVADKATKNSVPIKAKFGKKPKTKNCGSGIGGKAICSKKVKLGSKSVRVYVSDGVSQVADEIKATLKENGFECDTISLDDGFDCEELALFKEGGNVFLFSEAAGAVEQPLKWLRDAVEDSKYGKAFLADFQFAVYSTGSSNFNIAQDWDNLLWKLGGQRLKKVNYLKGEEDFEQWRNELGLMLKGQCKKKCGCGPKKIKPITGAGADSSSCSSSEEEEGSNSIVDVEDLLK